MVRNIEHVNLIRLGFEEHGGTKLEERWGMFFFFFLVIRWGMLSAFCKGSSFYTAGYSSSTVFYISFKKFSSSLNVH